MSITLKKQEEELYNILQENALKIVQQLSGQIWTDYNEHDPGVTILDLLNYVLWELDYQLSFNLEDYLTTITGRFNPDAHGLFRSSQVFSVSPVTIDDYRRLIFEEFDDIEDVQIDRHKADLTDPYSCNGLYDIRIQLNLWSNNSIRQRYVRNRVKALFHANRNLCESLNRIDFVDWQQLDIEAELEIDIQADASALLASIYIEGNKLFSSEKSLKQMSNSAYFTSRLYERVMNLPEVKCIYSLKLVAEPEICNRHATVRFPKKMKEVKIALIKGGIRVQADMEVVSRLFYQYRISLNRKHHPLVVADDDNLLPTGKNRDIYTYYSVQNDFPNCYGINKWGVAPHEPVLRKAQANQLKAYLLVFDLLFAKGLKELEELPDWMTLNRSLPADENPDLSNDPLLKWNVLVDKEIRAAHNAVRKRTLEGEKNKWLDVLDKLYGEDSNPAFLAGFNYYDETPEQMIGRRTDFLRNIPEWGRDRFNGINLYDISAKGRSGIEKYIHSLLGFAGVPGHPTANLYASYNVSVLNDTIFFSKLGWLIDYHLIMPERRGFARDELQDIQVRTQPWSDQDYSELREEIPFLRHGFLFESFLQGACKKDNFKRFYIPGAGSHLLLFFHEEKREWICLGRFNTEEKLTRITNCLISFLFMLNRKSETFYVVEHLLLRPIRPDSAVQEEEDDFDAEEVSEEDDFLSRSDELPLDFALSVVFAGGSLRMADPLFRKQMESLVLDRLPIHLEIRFLWLRPEQTALFERIYFAWREALSASSDQVANRLSARLVALLIKLRNQDDND